MEDDLEFLINALSVPNTPLTEPYDELQLLEMRESFKTLQKLLRRSSLPVEASLRSMPRSKAGGQIDAFPSMLALVDKDSERASDQVWNSADSGARSSPIISECGLRDWGKENPSADIGDRALVPYEELCNERSSSDTTITSRSFASSGISISIPVHLVWNNKDFNQQSTDSETTIRADGCRYRVKN
ncbi:uncharacterized protein LOC6541185 [Drosophila erecta]|uniref:Uncharacterized protein n=1 Tax=Drosophila erecta TaxID=7220 RepID=B3N5D6_DROER|nr:uncharacterized protein LOC6541185 [Drosophila erecta]EDV59015.2 uncharacterized protein Dere_GG23653 [Drosophila erecta]